MLATLVIAVFVIVVRQAQREPLNFHRPNLIAASPDEQTVAISDFRANRIVLFDRDFRLITAIRHSNFEFIWGLDISETEIVVLNNRTVVSSKDGVIDSTPAVDLMFFDYSGSLLRSFAWEDEERPVSAPGAVSLQPDGSCIVADSQNHRIVFVGADGSVDRSFGTFGHTLDNLYYPSEVKLTADGNLLVADSYNNYVKIFSQTGEFKRVLAEKGQQPGQLHFPKHFDLDDSGNLYVSEFGNMRISVFDNHLNFVKSFSPAKLPEHATSQLKMLFGIVVLRAPKQVMVVDSLHSCIYVFDDHGSQTAVISELTP
ncbi:MAG: hypothetical protein CVV42_11395 [Candidatus Riflebacteria bacterium HGW-Riflebacteria-2]|nr:MAG: hypothetical protein CVV42_11395 [Candidatus Riflebacteria bacterium HGW-Riflebacteria-2]